MSVAASPGLVKTRFFIISDTHGDDFRAQDGPIPQADVAIHCGDLTEESKLDEFRTALKSFAAVQAPLKLIIAGNHDFTLDTPAFKEKVATAQSSLEPDLVKKIYGDYGEARQLIEDARSARIVFLDEGEHYFTLANGATLTVYASPFTPSLSDWGFQFHPNDGHNFSIRPGVDLVMTHGPPRGIMDYTDSKQRAGSTDLFEAVARARPRLHCFGHIHEGWGAKKVAWRKEPTEKPSHFTDIDGAGTKVVETLKGLRAGKFDSEDVKKEKDERDLGLRRQGCISTSHCAGDEAPLRFGEETLFVNAAIQSTEECSLQLPWVVDIELPAAD
ncbi:uncharacterized protein KY384_005646 [Bacidia gigantensis]|uniref:uncharacterized protein n=1 Tax=Bacidia gigantensis TaxID=2732470 RepID=UPI001D0508AC|nr:uncharacterized protein KY384_005646 [Bacidia gigantensis]KAG8530163.1 hypothetical protein KY384_005646 [Bacidia gigantensis]